jgi:hypothetical protein
MTEPVTLKLRKPITLGSQTITELTFRPIKGKDLRRLKEPAERAMAMTLELAGLLSGQTTQVIDEIEGEDLQEVLRVVSGFFGATPGTGTEPSQSSQ